jgi:hypothetical protein
MSVYFFNIKFRKLVGKVKEQLLSAKHWTEKLF